MIPLGGGPCGRTKIATVTIEPPSLPQRSDGRRVGSRRAVASSCQARRQQASCECARGSQRAHVRVEHRLIPRLDQGQPRATAMGRPFALLLVGYGTKVGLAPLHNWLPDAHAEGPTPVSAVLSGLLLNVALYAVIRCKVLAEGSIHALPGRMLMGFGLLSALLGAFFLWRQRDIKRLFGYSSIEHMGIVTFAFGMGGPVANFAALLHMTVHSLTKSAIFFAAGHASQTAAPSASTASAVCWTEPHHRLGPDAGRAGHPRHAAVRRLRQRVPDPDHRDAGSRLGDADPPRRARCRHSRRSSAASSRWCSGRPRRVRCRTPRPCCRCSRTWRSSSRWACTCRRRWRSGTGWPRG